MIRFLTDLADQSVLLPVALLLAPFLVLAGWRRGALAWIACFLLAYGTMALLKLLFTACGSAPMTSPSGHTMAGTLVYGGMALLLAPRRAAPLVLAASVLLAMGLGYSRVVLHAHTVQEAILGGAIGLATLLLLHRLLDTPPDSFRSRCWLVLLPLLAIPFRHGDHSHTETFLQRLGQLYVRPALACRPGRF